MICDGIENCFMYINNFNPKKSLNPFAYFTQIIYYAFLRRIQKEKKQLYTKHKMLENSMLMNSVVSRVVELAFNTYRTKECQYKHSDQRKNKSSHGDAPKNQSGVT